MKVKLEDRFSNVELFRMFSVSLPKVGTGHTPKLWGYRKRSRKLGRVKPHIDDSLAEGVSVHPPGTKERVEDMAKWAAENHEVSAFAE